MATLLTKPALAKKSPETGGGIVVVNGRPDFSIIQRIAADLLKEGLNPYQLRLNSKMLSVVTESLENWLGDYDNEVQSQIKQVPHHARDKWLRDRVDVDDRRTPESQAIRFLTDFLFQFAERRLLDLERLRQGNQRFRNTVSKIPGRRQREQAILRYAEELGANATQLRGDEKSV